MLLTLLRAGAAADADAASEAMLTAACCGHRGAVSLLLDANASVFAQVKGLQKEILDDDQTQF